MCDGGEVQRDEGKGLACTAGGEDDIVVIAEPHELLDVRLCLLMYLVVGGRTVADLEDGHAGAIKVQELRLYLSQNVLGQDGGAGVEVINAFIHHVSPSLSFHYSSGGASVRVMRIWATRARSMRSTSKV